MVRYDEMEQRPISFRYGEILFGRLDERFLTPLCFSRERDYEHQWQKGIQRLLHGHETSCLVTGMRDPAVDGVWLDWYPMYRVGHLVALREESFRRPRGFDPQNPYEYVIDRDWPARPDEPPRSEWRTSLSDLEEALRALSHTLIVYGAGPR